MSLHVEFHPPGLPETGQKVCGGGGGWVVVVVVVVESEFSDPLWQSFSLALVKPNNNVLRFTFSLFSFFFANKVTQEFLSFPP